MLAEFNWMQAIVTSWISLVLVGCSIVTLGIALERAYYFWKREGKPDETLAQCLRKIRTGDHDSALSACESSVHPLGPVAAEIFKKAAGHLESLEERMQIALSQQKLLLERNLGVLATMAGIAPLIGLLGTVWGIMRAFKNMAQTGSAAPVVVASGVAEALITTAIGLIIAVPALVLYNHFYRRMIVMLTVAENHSYTIRTALLDTEAGREVPPRSRDDSGEHSRGLKSPALRAAVDPEPTLSR